MSDLVERLRDMADQRHMDRGNDAVDDALREAADRIEAIEKENAELRQLADDRLNDAVRLTNEKTDYWLRIYELEKALEPFAREADCYDPDDGDGDQIPWGTPVYFKIRDLRRARLASTERTEG